MDKNIHNKKQKIRSDVNWLKKKGSSSAKKVTEATNSKEALVNIFRNTIGSADSQSQPAYLSFEALNQLMNNMDMQQFDYDGFKQVYDANPELLNLVKNFD